MTKTRVCLFLAGAAIGALAYGIFLWNTTHFHLGYWAQVHTGTINEPGPYYGFFSGFGSDLGEVVLIGGVATVVAGMWHKFNCHNERCWRIGIHHVAGGQYVVCRKHNSEITGHPHRKLTTEFLRMAHCEHLEKLGCQHDAPGTTPELLLSEHSDGYQTDWYCEPPLPGQGFIVRSDEWSGSDGEPVRRIFQIELAEPVLHRVHGDLVVRADPEHGS